MVVGRVRAFITVMKKAKTKSFQARIKTKIEVARIAGATMGTTILTTA